MDYYIQPVSFYADFNHPINPNSFTESPTTMWIDVFGIHYAWSRQNKKKHWFLQAAIKDHRLMEAQCILPPSPSPCTWKKCSIVEFICSAIVRVWDLAESRHLIGTYPHPLCALSRIMGSGTSLAYLFMYSAHERKCLSDGGRQHGRRRRHRIKSDVNKSIHHIA